MPDSNPFIYDKPLPPIEVIDRKEEINKLLELAEGAHNCRLSAPRRYGKTTLIKRVIDDAEKAGLVTVYVDFYAVLSTDEIIFRMESAYRESLQGPLKRWFIDTLRMLDPKANIGVPGGSIEIGTSFDTKKMETIHHLLDLPRGIYKKSGQRTLVVFDEFQDVLSAHKKIDGVIRSRIQHHVNEASYIFSGSHPGLMAELFGKTSRPLYGQARAMQLNPLDDRDLSDYIGRRFVETDREPGDALESLLRLAQGHPQRAMLVAHHLWEATSRGASADESTWSATLSAVFSELSEVFELAWKSHNDGERRVLSALSRGKKSLFSKETLHEFGLSKAKAYQARERLVGSGELTRHDSQAIIVDPLFAEWVRRGQRWP